MFWPGTGALVLASVTVIVKVEIDVPSAGRTESLKLIEYVRPLLEYVNDVGTDAPDCVATPIMGTRISENTTAAAKNGMVINFLALVIHRLPKLFRS